MSKALAIDEFRLRTEQLGKDIDRFKYNNNISADVGKRLATAINELLKIEKYIKDAGYEQAMNELVGTKDLKGTS